MSEETPMEEFQPPFSTAEILGDNSRDFIHKRPLMNAESMLKRGKYKSALEIYARTISRFKNPEAKNKLKAIVLSLQDFLKKNDTRSGTDHKLSPIDPERDFSSALKELTDNLTDSLTEGLQQLDKIQDELPDELSEEDTEPPKKENSPPPIFVPTSRIDVPEGDLKDLESGVGLEYPKGLVVPPIQMPVTIKTSEKEESDDYHGIETSGTLKRDDIFSHKKPKKEKPEIQEESDASSEKVEITLKVEGNDLLSEKESKIDEDFETLKDKLNLGLPGGLPGGSWEKGSISDIPPSIPDMPQAEILSHLLHQEDWGPYKHLPIQDRRGGEERRKSKKPVPKERRTNKERRNRDLFQERDDYLKQWSEKVEQIRQQYGHFPTDPEISSKAEWPSVEFGSAGDFGDLGILGLPQGGEGEKGPDLIEINLPEPVDESKPTQSPIDQDKLNEYFPQNPPDIKPPPENYIEPANVEYIQPPGTPELIKISLPNPLTMKYDGFDDAPKRNISWIPGEELPDVSESGEEQERKITTDEVLYPTRRDFQVKELFKIELPEPEDIHHGLAALESGGLPDSVLDEEAPEVDLVESDAPPPEDQELEIPQIEPEPEPERMIHGILELKPPEVDDAPFLTLTYDFSKIPHSFRLSKNYSIMEYSYYKYKTMLMKAQEFARRKMLKNALNYYRVIKSQNIPPELKKMINRNIMDITEFLEKYLMSKGGG